MSSFNGPGAVSNGLVFAYDMGSQEKSWKGAPTTNLHPIGGYISWPSQTLHFWNGNNWVVDGTYTDPGVPGPVGTYLGVVRKYTSGALSASWSGNSYAYILKTAPMTAGVSYAMSAYTFLSSDCNIGGMGSSIEGASVSALAGGYQTSYDMSRKGSWQRQGLQGTASGNVNFILAYPYREGVTNGSFTGSILVGGAQVEVGTFPTPYTDSSRSNTQALLDLTNRNTITATSLTYNSDGTFSFVNSADVIDIPSTSLLNLTSVDFSIELWVYIDPSVDTSGVYHGLVEIGSAGSTFLIGIWRSGLFPGCLYNTFGGSTMFGTDGSGGYLGANYKLSGSWNHVVFTRNGATSFFYLNGNIWATRSTPSIPNASNNLKIGSSPSAGNFPGRIPVFRFYNGRALTATEVQQNFQALRGRYGI